MDSKKTARFTVSADNGEVQEVGYRCFLVEFFMDHGLECEEPINSPDGSTVSIVVSGGEEIIKGVYERLKTEKPKTEKVEGIKLSPINWSDNPINKKADLTSLMFRQLNKGIPAVVNIGDAMKGMGGNIESINNVVVGLDDKYGAISKKMNIQTVIQFLIIILIFLSLIYGSGFF